MKIVINDGMGSYGLSLDAYAFLDLDWEKEVVYPLERVSPGISNDTELFGLAYQNDRMNKRIVNCVEELGSNAGWSNSHLVVVNVDKTRPWKIETDEFGWERIQYLDE